MKDIVHPTFCAALLHATHCDAHQSGQAADLRVAQWSMASNWLEKLILADGADVFGPSYAVFAKAGFAGTQKQVPGAELLNGG